MSCLFFVSPLSLFFSICSTFKNVLSHFLPLFSSASQRVSPLSCKDTLFLVPSGDSFTPSFIFVRFFLFFFSSFPFLPSFSFLPTFRNAHFSISLSSSFNSLTILLLILHLLFFFLPSFLSFAPLPISFLSSFLPLFSFH